MATEPESVTRDNWHTIVSELVELRNRLDAVKPDQQRTKKLMAGIKAFMVSNSTESIDGLGENGRYSLELKDRVKRPGFAALACGVVTSFMQQNNRLPSDAELKAAVAAEQKRLVEIRKAELKRMPLNAPERDHALLWKDSVAIEARRKAKLQRALVDAGYSADAVIMDQDASTSHVQRVAI